MKRCLAWLLLLACGQAFAAAAAELAAELEARIAAIAPLEAGESVDPVRELTRELLAAIRADTSGAEQARLLAALRDRCLDVLPWTDEALLAAAEAAVGARRPLKTEEPSAFVRDLLRLGFIYFHHARLEPARRHYEEAVALARDELGKDSPQLAGALDALSYLLVDQGEFEGALEAANRSLAIRRSMIPPDPTGVIHALNARATIRFYREELTVAAADWEEALALSETLSVTRDHELIRARMESNLGEIYRRSGDLGAAQVHLEEARRLRAGGGAVGAPVRQLASTLVNLADLYYAIGDYPAAIDALKEAVEGHRRWLGKDTKRLGEALSAFALVLEESGRWDEALARQLQAVNVHYSLLEEQKARGEAQTLHRYRLALARSLARLGALRFRMGEPEARPPIEEALAIQESELAGRPHSDLAWTLLALARLEADRGTTRAARTHVERAIAMLTEIDPNHPLLVDALSSAASISVEAGVGLELAAKGRHLAIAIYGPDSPQVADLRFVEARLQRGAGAPREAVASAVSAYALSQGHIAQVVRAFPETQALSFAADRRRYLDLALTLLRAEGPRLSDESVNSIWEAMAGGRALVLDTQLARQNLVRATEDPVIGEYANRLVAARNRLAFLLIQSYRDPEDRRSELARARREAVDAEESLARASARQPDSSRRPVRAAEVRQALPAGARLLSIVEYRDVEWAEETYMAFVLSPEASAPQWVTLGPAKPIDELIASWRDQLTADFGGSEDSEADSRAVGESLRRRLWEPLAEALGGPGMVFVVPDGSLNLVNLAALPTADDGYLLERGWLFHTLSVERDLLAEHPTNIRNQGLLLVGGVDYQGGRPRSSPSAVLAERRSSNGPRCRLPYFASLPASLEEIEAIASLWEQAASREETAAAVVLSGSEANESRVRALVSGREIVHMATHGFVTTDGCAMPRAGTRGIGGLAIHSESLAPPEALLLAGLALAGANQRSASPEVGGDGLLLAEEVVDLDLRGVVWVVLSACESGLGGVVSGEGVLGLRRAFQLSGARTLILSLWSANDRATREWMQHLYYARLVAKKSTVASVHDASLATLEARRSRGQSTSPAFWAAFVAAGDWR